MRAMKLVGETEVMLVQIFKITLIEAAFRWFLNMEDSRAWNWEDICWKFHNQYKYKMEVDVMRRDLETTKQEPKESFVSFITKWRSKATQMMNRPNEEKQLTMVVNNLLPIYHKYLFGQYFPIFKALIVAETQIEDVVNNGTIKIEEASKFKRNFGPSNSKTALISNIYKIEPY